MHLQHRSPGTKAVIIGAELVSWSAAVTLREAGCQVVTLVTEQPGLFGVLCRVQPGRPAVGLHTPVAAKDPGWLLG